MKFFFFFFSFQVRNKNIFYQDCDWIVCCLINQNIFMLFNQAHPYQCLQQCSICSVSSIRITTFYLYCFHSRLVRKDGRKSSIRRKLQNAIRKKITWAYFPKPFQEKRLVTSWNLARINDDAKLKYRWKSFRHSHVKLCSWNCSENPSKIIW